MKLSHHMIVSLLVLPGPAAAQAPTPADLVGTWVWSRVVQFRVDTLVIAEQYFALAADSTYTQGIIEHWFAKSSADSPWAPVHDGVHKEKKLYQWQLRSDTLMFGRGKNTEGYPVALQGQQLKVRLGNCVATWEHRDLAKPAITLPPATFKRADLAGTWVRDEQEQPDTLWLKADGTLQYAGMEFPPSVKATGPVSGANWDITLGGYLYLPYKDSSSQQREANLLFWMGPAAVVREGNQPVIVTNKSTICSNSPEEKKYKRVGP